MNKAKKLTYVSIMLCIGLFGCALNQKNTNPTTPDIPEQINWSKFNYKHDFLKRNIKSNKHIMLYITSDYCSACEYFNETALSSTRIIPIVNHSFKAIKLNVDNIPEKHIDNIVAKLNIEYLPTVILYSKHNSEYKEVIRIIGAVSKFDLLKLLRATNSLNLQNNLFNNFTLRPLIFESFNKSKL